MRLRTKEIERLSLKPGDLAVFRHPEALTKESATELYERLKIFIPDNEVLILDAGASLNVISRNGHA